MAISGITELKPTRQENIVRPEIDDIKTRVHKLEVQELPYVTLATVTTKGDLLVATGAAILARLAVGANNLVLLADSATATGLKWGQVPTAGIANLAITAAQIANNTITATQIANNTITAAQIAGSTITTAQIADGTIANADLANMADSTLKGRNVGAGAGAPIDLSAFDVVGIIKTQDGAGSGLDADLLDGLGGAAYAQLAAVQTFTNANSFTPSATNIIPMAVNMPASNSVDAMTVKYNGALRMRIIQNSIRSQYVFSDFDNTNDIGPHTNIGRNNNASTPAAGFLYIKARTGTQYAVWPDNAGNLRIGTELPTNAQDTSGAVVGTQTSSLDSKNILGDVCPPEQALRNIRHAARWALRRFTYKSGAYDQEFEGLITDYAPRYGMDKDEAHPAGKSLNIISALSDIMQAISLLADRLDQLEGD